MKDLLPRISLDEIPTLVDHNDGFSLVITFCPVCDRMAEARDDGRGIEGAKALCIANTKIHISKTHRPKSRRTNNSTVIRQEIHN